MTIPADWLPAANMQRIIMHWTGGPHDASELDRRHYHMIVEGSGRVVRGIPSIAANEAPARPGYAAHTLNCNSGSIGVSMACMGGAVEAPFDAGKFPMLPGQLERFIDLVAEIAIAYQIPVSTKTILSHAEVQPTLGIRQRGKWDIARIPFKPALIGPAQCGDFIRSRVREAIDAAKGKPTLPALKAAPDGSIIYRASVIATVLNIRETPSVAAPIVARVKQGDIVEIHGTEDRWANVQTAFGARGWASRDYLRE